MRVAAAAADEPRESEGHLATLVAERTWLGTGRAEEKR